MKKVIPVILAGGIGERFWPMSRSTMPKQLLKIISNKTMIEETIARVASFCVNGVKPLIITSEAIAATMKSILPASLEYDLIVEPVGKNTAPAVAIAAKWIQEKYGDVPMVVLSADHDIRPERSFKIAIETAVRLAESQESLVVFGVKPSRPETGYGYIELGDKLALKENEECYKVKCFVEKPDYSKAQELLESGLYMWNSGMFVWNTSVILEEINLYMPELFVQVSIVSDNKFSKNSIDAYYRNCIKESIDFGIMEHSKRVRAVIGDFSWDDIGSWESLSRIHGENESKTTCHGAQICEKECTNTILFNNSHLSIASIGVDNVVLVATDDSLLLIARDKLPDLKKHLNEIKSEGSLPKNLF